MITSPPVRGPRSAVREWSECPVAGSVTCAYAAIGLLVLALAIIVALTAAGPARAALGYQFGPVPMTPGEALAVFAHNLRTLAIGAGGAVVVGSRRDQCPLVLRVVCDALVAFVAGINATVAGVSLGAYGSRMAAAMLPHGPLELLAFAAGITLYVRARLGAVSRSEAIALVALAVGALMIAAPLEVFVRL